MPIPAGTYRFLIAVQNQIADAAMHFGRGKSVTLTFDDGPLFVGDASPRGDSGRSLREILKTLADHKPPIHAEFYVQGNHCTPELLNLIHNSRHRLQNHTWDHKVLPKLSLDEVRQEVKKTQEMIAESVKGATPTKVRPPFGVGGYVGHIDPKVARVAHELNLKIQNWDIDTVDWGEKRGLRNEPVSHLKGMLRFDYIKQTVKMTKKDSLIVLMHVRPETARDLPSFIPQLEDWGFGFAEPSN